MSGPTPCEECGRPMAATAVACPHCGARQAGRDPLPEGERPAPGPLAKAKPTREEMAALLAIESVNAPVVATGPGLLSVLFFPHPMTTGVGRVLDVLLTLVALPLMLSGLILLVTFGRRRGFAVATRQLNGRVELTAALFAVVLGSVSLLSFGFFTPLPQGLSPLLLVGVGTAALFARLFVRNAAER